MSVHNHDSSGGRARHHAQRSVPVRQRIEVGGTRRQRRPRERKRVFRALGMSETLVYIAAALAVLSVIAIPLHTYMQQRSDINDLRSSIAAKQEEKKTLEKELARNTSEPYRDEQIRRRLGAIAEGETAFRIIDPAMTNPSPVTSKGGNAELDRSRPWYTTVWQSVMDPRAGGVLVPDPAGRLAPAAGEPGEESSDDSGDKPAPPAP